MSNTGEKTAATRSLILLHPEDNVLVAVASLSAGAEVTIDGEPCVIAQGIAVGHKLARQPISAGEKIIKYGAPIGSLTAAAHKGEWVHSHNMQSDYLPSHVRNKGSAHHSEQER
ncbi:UxaA family hydrolase [Marinimicrobium alkaliphilum]|uniref:UxaA family hydrolase n=1 Tax=Marinimicrobium alkaliphilum TaxID=2202654 RepID=UPI000DB99623|nr:UxaA family hydrolase [Marinimicrobium alkaliphilum]